MVFAPVTSEHGQGRRVPLGLDETEPQASACSLRTAVLDGQLSVVQVGNALGDGQTEAAAAFGVRREGDNIIG